MTEALITIGSVFVGGLITWGVAWFYYRRAGQELVTEAERLRRLIEILAGGLEEGEIAEFRRNAEGNLVGNIRTKELDTTVNTSASVTMHVIRAHDESD